MDPQIRARRTWEFRVRRALRRQGMVLAKSRARDPLGLDHGRYVVADRHGANLAGMFPGDGLTLDEVEAWLARSLEPPGVDAPAWEVLCVEALAGLQAMPDDSIDCIVTSPPYFFLRDYRHPDQIGLERSRSDYIDRLVVILAEAARVLKSSGTMWLNLADSTCTRRAIRQDGMRSVVTGASLPTWVASRAAGLTMNGSAQFRSEGIVEGSLFNIPHLVVEALRKHGLLFRSEITWIKTVRPARRERLVPMPATEPIFMLTKQASGYTFNPSQHTRTNAWTFRPSNFKDDHTAMMPVELARTCIEISTNPGDTVLDMFGGLGTTAKAATELGRRSVLLELNPEYVERARKRLGSSK